MLTIKNWRASGACLGLALAGAISLTGCRPAGPKALLDGESLLHAGKYTLAIQKLQTATQLLPANAQAWNHLGLAYHHARQPAAALQAYQQARHCDPNLATVRYNLGCLLLEQNNALGAVAELTSFTVLQRDSADAWIKLGTAHLHAHQSDAAERSFQEAVRLRPDLAEAWNGLGVAQIQRRRAKEALNSFTVALQKQPNYAPALLNVAVVHQQYLNNRPLALQKYQDYLELDPVPPEAATVQEIVRQLRAELTPPHREPTNTVTVLPPPTAPLIANTPHPATNISPARTPANTPPVATALAPTNRARALPTNTVALADSNSTSKSESQHRVETSPAPTPKPPTPEPKAETPVEVVHLAEERPPTVAQDSTLPLPSKGTPATGTPTKGQETTVPAPNHSDELARTQAGAVDKGAAEKRSVLDRMNPTTWFRGKKRTATTPTPLEPLPEEKPAARPVEQVELRPRYVPPAKPVSPPAVSRRYAYLSPPKTPPGERRKAEAYFARGVQLQRDGRLEEALTHYREAVKLDPRYFEAHYNRGLAAYQLKDWPQSLSAYEAALSINPTSANARYNFAAALEQGEYYEDAVNELEKLLEQHPNEARAHFSLASLYAQKLSRPDLARVHYRKVLELEPQHPRASDIRFWLASNP